VTCRLRWGGRCRHALPCSTRSTLVELTTDDPHAGLEAPDGRTFQPRGGIITLPDEMASFGERAARQAPMFHIRRHPFAGADVAELRARYEMWAAERKRRATV
jgi:hypothetical protein